MCSKPSRRCLYQLDSSRDRFISDNLSVSMCNNKNPKNIRGFFPVLQGLIMIIPGTLKISRAAKSSKRSFQMPDSVSSGSTAVQSVTLFAQARQVLMIYLNSSSCFPASFLVLPGFSFLCFVLFCFSWPVQSLCTCFQVRSRNPLSWYPSNLPPILLVYQKA